MRASIAEGSSPRSRPVRRWPGTPPLRWCSRTRWGVHRSRSRMCAPTPCRADRSTPALSSLTVGRTARAARGRAATGRGGRAGGARAQRPLRGRVGTDLVGDVPRADAARARRRGRGRRPARAGADRRGDRHRRRGPRLDGTRSGAGCPGRDGRSDRGSPRRRRDHDRRQPERPPVALDARAGARWLRS